MISSVLDYKFVTGNNVDEDHPHGDLDRIVINGGIYPIRRTSIVRGEDAAFLMEGMCERGSVSSAEFSWIISPAAINMALNLGSEIRKWVPKNSQFSEIHWESPTEEIASWPRDKIAEIYGAIFSEGPSADSSWQAYDEISSGEVLRLEPLVKAFNNLNICRKAVETFYPHISYRSSWKKTSRYYNDSGEPQTELVTFYGNVGEETRGLYRAGNWTAEESWDKDVIGDNAFDNPSARSSGFKLLAGVKSQIILCIVFGWSHNVGYPDGSRTILSKSYQMMFPLSKRNWYENCAAYLSPDDINAAFTRVKAIAAEDGYDPESAKEYGAWDEHAIRQIARLTMTLFDVIEINELSDHTNWNA